MKKKLKRMAYRVRGYFDTDLPYGVTQFSQFCDKIFFAYNIPDAPSYRRAVAIMIQHLNPTTNRAPMRFFAKSIRKSQANQVAFEVIQEINAKEKEDDAGLKANEAVTA